MGVVRSGTLKLNELNSERFRLFIILRNELNKKNRDKVFIFNILEKIRENFIKRNDFVLEFLDVLEVENVKFQKVLNKEVKYETDFFDDSVNKQILSFVSEFCSELNNIIYNKNYIKDMIDNFNESFVAFTKNCDVLSNNFFSDFKKFLQDYENYEKFKSVSESFKFIFNNSEKLFDLYKKSPIFMKNSDVFLSILVLFLLGLFSTAGVLGGLTSLLVGGGFFSKWKLDKSVSVRNL